MPTLELDGRRIAWREGGQGEPALLLHCALAHSGAFSGLMAALADRLAMRALDLPGHGGTDRDPRLGMQTQAVADARALLERTGPAHLVGHSFGGTAALRLALEAPALVRTLTLIEPVMFGFLADAGSPAYAETMAAEGPFRAAAARGDWQAAADAFVGRWGMTALAALPEARADYVRRRMPIVIESERDIYDHPERRVRLADLERLMAPLLLVEGADSPPAVRAILDLITAAVPGARRLTVEGAAHMVPLTHPDAVAEAIRALLDAAPARPC